jgi:3-hydroxyisobutyrate dehydrogenase-like beta-hydroxyacid dehydrogenase
MSRISRVALIGFGEVGRAAAAELAKAGVEAIIAWDVKFAAPETALSPSLGDAPVALAASALEAVRDADLVLCAVTAAQDLAAAESCAAGLAPGAFFLDVNSASPGAKRAAAACIEAAGGRYVEAAVMSPIEPRRLASPMLLGGPHAAAFLASAEGLGFTGARVYAAEIGRAAATKLCRSVVIKGMEALLAESLLAARHYGVEEVVLASLSDLLPMPDWPARADYMIARALEHGARRAEEMREAAVTVREAGIEPILSAAIAVRQDWAAGHADALAAQSLADRLDRILAGIAAPTEERDS